jgi:hypothetical protein
MFTSASSVLSGAAPAAGLFAKATSQRGNIGGAAIAIQRWSFGHHPVMLPE